MTNQPLNSSEQSKILIFTLLLVPSVAFGIGAIPALFIGFGIFMMKKNKDFSHIETAVKNSKVYISLLLIGCVISALYFGSTYGNPEYIYEYNNSWKHDDEFGVSVLLSIIAFTYLILIKVLFLTPLKSHSEWVEINGIFSSKPQSSKTLDKDSKVDIIKGEKLKSYSVADELLKWAKLKENGHISEEEYDAARKKLLK